MKIPLRLGRVVMTRNALNRVHESDVLSALGRHARGDWGDVCADDREANEWSVSHGARIVSRYRDRNGVRFWIITEGDRSATTVLLPEDY